MEEKLEKINDIIQPQEGNKGIIVDIARFFQQSTLKAFKLTQNNLFSDIYQELEEKLDLRYKKILKISRFRLGEFSDIVRNTSPKASLTDFLSRRKNRVLENPINILEPIVAIGRNSLDVRNLEVSAKHRTYPDIYMLPLLPKQVIRKFYKKNANTIWSGLSTGVKFTSIGVILILALGLFGIGYKNYMQAEVTSSYQRIYALKSIKDPLMLKGNAKDLRTRFRTLKLLFAPIDLLGNNFIYTNKSVKKADNVINAGEQVSNIALIGGSVWEDLKKEKKSDQKGLSGLKNIRLTEFFKKEESNLIDLDQSMKETIGYFSQIDSLGNPALEEKFQSTLENLIKSEKYLSFILKNRDMLLELGGDKKPMRYFVLNQNKDEIRANGGFPGSVITIDLYKGNILKYDKKDIYFYDWHLSPYRETPPEGLNIISPNHGMRDANYDPIFLESVKKINFFYEKSGGGSIDTIIAINQGIVEDFLRKYGSVHLDEINTDITADNFSLIMSTLVENKFQKVVSPKDILFRFSEKFEKKLIDKGDYMGYIDMIINNIIGGEVLVASRDTGIQKYIDSLGVFEPWKKDGGNWVYPVFTSISGNKSDRYMIRDFKIASMSRGGCEVNNSFSLTSKNSFDTETQAEIRKAFDELKISDSEERDRLMAIEGAGENRQFVRILAPKGSKLGNTYGNNINMDDSNPDYTFFKFYLNTDVGQTSVIRFDYSSKPKDCKEDPIFYKQPGLANYTFTKN